MGNPDFEAKSMKLRSIVFVKNKSYEKPTRIYLEKLNVNDDEFYLPVENRSHLVGYLKFKKTTKKGCFELSELVSQDYPNPNPQLSLSGVLYSRQEALEADQLIGTYQLTVSRIP